MRRAEILSYLTEIKPSLVEKGIEKIGLFGSFARDDADLYSDIDIVIKTTPTFVQRYGGFKGFLFLEELRKEMKMKWHREVDLCDEADLRKKEILKDVIYA